jgi:hypothetical protein
VHENTDKKISNISDGLRRFVFIGCGEYMLDIFTNLHDIFKGYTGKQKYLTKAIEILLF